MLFIVESISTFMSICLRVMSICLRASGKIGLANRVTLSKLSNYLLTYLLTNANPHGPVPFFICNILNHASKLLTIRKLKPKILHFCFKINAKMNFIQTAFATMHVRLT